MNNYKQREEDVIDLQELAVVLFGKLWMIILSGVILGIIAIAGTKLFITPQYQSTTKMYVLAKQNTDVLTSSDLQAGALLTKDYAEMIKSRTVAESTIDALGLTMSPEVLIGKISVKTSTDTRVLAISVTAPDPVVARDIADTVRDMAAEHIKSVMNIEAVNVVDKANTPDSPISPSVKKNGLMGGMLGCVLAAAVIVFFYMMNDTIKTEEDVEKYLGISTLGVVPIMKGEAVNGRKMKKSKRGKKS